ncbi:MAG: hypothetical protein GTO02_06375 [Candidatus Dadabacteria bacterium]|nr:hypothetical protein [Candidatus Dadabacteria bacterium]NIQ14027.1 hypothetical protein [Candidatus Dadabacteria bacterium]
MEILISMKGVDDSKYSFKNPYMNEAFSQRNGYFIAEIREHDLNKVRILQKYGIILLKKLKEKGKYSIEETKHGFKLMRKVNEDKNYTDDWDEWAEFSNLLYQELTSFFEDDE